MFPKLIISVIYFLLGGFAHFGDIIVSNIEPRFYTWRSITDNTFHFFIAILTWILVYYHSNSKCYVFSSLVYECLLTGLIGSAVDVDHFVVARTFSVKVSKMHLLNG